MDGLHFHLLINHLPIFGLSIGIVWLLIALLMRNKSVINAALITLFVVGLMTIPAYLSGEPAEHGLNSTCEINEHVLEEHEELGFLSLLATLVTGLAAGASWFLNRTRNLNWLNWIVLVFALASFPIIAITNSHGGQIRRPELWTGSSAAPGNGSSGFDFDDD